MPPLFFLAAVSALLAYFGRMSYHQFSSVTAAFCQTLQLYIDAGYATTYTVPYIDADVTILDFYLPIKSNAGVD